MALVTVERSTPSPQESEEDLEVMSGSSGYEGFVATRSLVMFLPHRQWTHSNNKELLAIETHLKKLCKLSRPEDTVKLIIELENINNGTSDKTRYLVLLTTIGYQSREECIILGTENDGEDSIKIGLVLPVWSDTKIKLDGDGGFIVYTADRHHLFKPTSVQSMWSALQMLFKYSEVSRVNNFYVGGLSHTWVSWYTRSLTDNRSILNEWNLMEDIDLLRIDSPSFFALGKLGEEKDSVKKLLTFKLRELMLHEDLEAVSVKQLKKKVSDEVGMDLSPYNAFLDQQMMVILKQMEKPSKIYDYLYLGSEWNAADLDELQDIGIGYILNVTREIDNFYPGMFKYKNIRVFDVSSSDLLKHWDDTYKFIKEAKMAKSSVLVHCKMGISRSASTVIAYAMKEYQLTLQEATAHVKKCRNVINPNSGFCKQLHTYEAILSARNNEVWGSKAPQRLLRAHRRSLSDPNIVVEMPHCESPISCHQLDSPKKYYPEYREGSLSAVHPLLTEEELRKSQLIETNQQTPEQKVLSYLESMAPYSDDEEDQGISENSPISNSNSSLSSPICLTPPDEAYLDKWRDGKVIPSSPPPKMSDQPVGKDIVVPSPLEREQVVDMAENMVGQDVVEQDANHCLALSKNSNFKPYTSEVDSSMTSQRVGLLEVSRSGMSTSRSYPENLAQLALGSAGSNGKEEKEEPAPRPVSVIGMSPSHRRVHSEAIITVMPTQKDWQQMEERKYGKSMSLVITKQIESVRERVKEMEQKQAQSTVGIEDHCEMRKSASCMNLRVHSRKGSILSNFSSQESSRPISQLSAHDKEDEATKKRRSNGSSPVNLTQITETTTTQEPPQETKTRRNSTSPTLPEDIANCSSGNDTTVATAQRDTVKAIIQDIEQKAFSTQSSTNQLKKRPLSESLSCVVPHSPVMPTRTSQIPIVYNKSLSQNSSSEEQVPQSPLMATRTSQMPTVYNKPLSQNGPAEEYSLTPPLKNRQHIRVRSYSSSPLTSPKLSPRLKRASPDTSEVFDHGIISSIGKGCYSKEKLSRRRSLDIYQKHGDFNLTSVPSVSHLKRLFEETAISQPSTSRSTSPNLKRSHSLRDLFTSSNSPVYRSSSLRSKEKPIFRK